MSKEILRLQKIAGLLTESRNEPLEVGDRILVTYGNEYYGHNGKIEDIKGGFVIVSIDDIDGEVSMHSSDVKKIEDMEDDADSFYDDDDYGSDNPEDGYGPRMQEDGIKTIHKIPQKVTDWIKNIKKDKELLSLVKQVVVWAEKSGKKITGGTSIGSNHDTLILDIRYQDGAIRIDIPDLKVELYDQPVFDAKSFAKALVANDQSKKD